MKAGDKAFGVFCNKPTPLRIIEVSYLIETETGAVMTISEEEIAPTKEELRIKVFGE